MGWWGGAGTGTCGILHSWDVGVCYLVEELEWGSGCMVAQDLKIQALCVILYLVWMVWSCVSTTYVVRVICPDSDIDVWVMLQGRRE